jgi:hypothetical protein
MNSLQCRGKSASLHCLGHQKGALLEKPPVAQLLKDFSKFYGTRRFITLFTIAFHWSISWARSIQSIQPHPVSLKSILILSTHLRDNIITCKELPVTKLTGYSSDDWIYWRQFGYSLS